ncbi:MAG: hypothetical protein OXI66_11415 [Boseongicola sp.]|nr:hypothetical protein [Boseongicola sp.]
MNCESLTDWTAPRLIDQDAVLPEWLSLIQRFLNRVPALRIHVQNALCSPRNRRTMSPGSASGPRHARRTTPPASPHVAGVTASAMVFPQAGDG